MSEWLRDFQRLLDVSNVTNYFLIYNLMYVSRVGRLFAAVEKVSERLVDFQSL